jgi:hypothetical protein
MDNQENFSREYIKDSGTKKQLDIKASSDMLIDTDKYGISKPKRVVLRAKITHGKADK